MCEHIKANGNIAPYCTKGDDTIVDLLAQLGTVGMLDSLGKSNIEYGLITKTTTALNPVCRAIVYHNHSVLEYFVTKFAHCKDLADKIFGSPIICAISSGDVRSLKILVENGANVDAKDSQGRTCWEQIYSSPSPHQKQMEQVFRDAFPNRY